MSALTEAQARLAKAQEAVREAGQNATAAQRQEVTDAQVAVKAAGG